MTKQTIGRSHLRDLNSMKKFTWPTLSKTLTQLDHAGLIVLWSTVLSSKLEGHACSSNLDLTQSLKIIRVKIAQVTLK